MHQRKQSDQNRLLQGSEPEGKAKVLYSCCQSRVPSACSGVLSPTCFSVTRKGTTTQVFNRLVTYETRKPVFKEREVMGEGSRPAHRAPGGMRRILVVPRPPGGVHEKEVRGLPSQTPRRGPGIHTRPGSSDEPRGREHLRTSFDFMKRCDHSPGGGPSGGLGTRGAPSPFPVPP